MPDEPSNPYDYIEAVAELAAEDEDFANWHNRHQHTLDAIGVGAESLDVIDQLAASHIAGLSTVLGGGVQSLIYKARSLAYQEGFHDGLTAANEADDEEEPDDPGCCVP